MSGAILVTGATGFVGRAVLDRLKGGERPVVALVRTWTPDLPSAVIQRLAGPIETISQDQWMAILEGVDVIVHLAAIAHIGRDVPEDRYDEVNHRAVTNLAEAARLAGVQRFVFMSSIRAQAGASVAGEITEASPPAPTDAYGRAKLAAERDLAGIGIEHVILRPVVIVGPQAKGNLALLLKLAATGLPLPFKSLAARRSMVSLADVVEATRRAIDDAAMAGKTIILADPEPLSLGDMITALRDGLDKPARLFAFPEALLALPFRLPGLCGLWQRIGGAMVARPGVAPSLGLRKQQPVREALRRLAQASRSGQQSSE